MTNFFQNVPSEAAQQIDSLSRILYDLREDRKRILSAYGVTEEDRLLAMIAEGEVGEHPAYDHYIAAKTLAQTRTTIWEQLRDVLANGV